MPIPYLKISDTFPETHFFLFGLIKIFCPNKEDNISTGNLYKLISTNTIVNKKPINLDQFLDSSIVNRTQNMLTCPDSEHA